ncbi:unnamed protein product [Rotaria sp. Silwood1]|nr:unnamed protein product [Rotaria sp. Silwood1]CAF1192816.1 unnamed protein product [Rotaria sp. Silwood1]CAF1196373.1 unnamed protein product [Rotaria sp. Silwood1]CAF3453934.1 unnamed protein product [Rotaria sp. Silwood1]CAF3467220.1 unnamed protein product [Rotaria sp. Silwood1]
MVESSMFVRIFITFFFFHKTFSNELRINTTSGIFEGKEVIIEYVPVRQFFGIPYGEKPVRFEMPILRKYNSKNITRATERTPGCLQASGGLSYGPFELSDMYEEDCLTLNMFIPKTKSLSSKAIMVFCHGGSNQVGSASLFDGSAIAALGNVIVITINYRLNILGFLTPGPDIMSGNYGLHDQILALKWVSINAKNFNGDPKRITYIGHSAGAANAVLLAMSKRSDGLIARVIAQSGCPLNQWAIDRQPSLRFDNVIGRHGMKAKKKYMQSNINQLKNISAENFRYMYHSGLEISPDYPFPIIDNDILSNNLEELIRTGPLVNVDLLVGVTADEALYFAEEHIFNHYLPRKYRTSPSLTTTQRPSTTKTNEINIVQNRTEKSIENEHPRGFSYFRKNNYIKNYLKTNYPDHLCYYEEIQARYMPSSKHQHNLTETARLYTNLVSDLMFYYDLIRFLHERLRSNTSASTYVYYYTNPPVFDLDNVLRRIPNMIGHFAELDLTWGIPYFNRKNRTNIAYNMNISYKSEEVELSLHLIRYWTNFAKTGNPNEPEYVPAYWPPYEKTRKSYINFNTYDIQIEDQFLEERFQFWHMILHRPTCAPFHWYHTCLLVGILILVLTLLAIYIFYNAKRSRRNIKPTETTNDDVVTTYHFLSAVVS